MSVEDRQFPWDMIGKGPIDRGTVLALEAVFDQLLVIAALLRAKK
jgi:hypothetical protein